VKNKVVIYTAIFGGFDELLEPEYIPEGCDFVCFTDSDFKSDVWDVRKVIPYYEQPVRNSRYYKTKPHVYLSNYDISIWIDGTFIVRKDVNDLIEKYLSNVNMACFNHNNTSLDPHNCIYYSADYILHLGNKNYNINPSRGLKAYKDDPKLITSQIEKYKKEGYPKDNGLVISGILFRRHNELDVIKVMEDWWIEINYHSHICQLSLPYVFWKNNFKFGWVDGDIRNNDYIKHIGKHTSKIVDEDIFRNSKTVSPLTDRVKGLDKIEISKEEFTILKSGLLALMGIEENTGLDIIISSTARHRVFDGRIGSINLDGINICESNKFNMFSSHGDDDLITNYSFQINGYNFLEPRFHFNKEDDNIEKFVKTEKYKLFPFNQLSKNKWGKYLV
jgi:hypothetical protein